MTPSLTLAGRELRADVQRGFKGFRIFLACLSLGVATIAGAGELSDAVQAGLRADARQLLGGDLSVSQMYKPLDPDALSYLAEQGRLSSQIEMRAMAKAETGARTLAEVKAVDASYPLAGRLRTEPETSDGLAERDGVYGSLCDANLLSRLNIKTGDVVELGQAKLRINATIAHEPDKAASPFQLGPRLLVSSAALEASGLMMPGSIERFVTNIAVSGTNPVQVQTELEKRFPNQHWRIRSYGEAAPGLKRFLDNLALFLTLTGLAGLLVGGIGVANAIKSHLDTKLVSIAILKSVGASNRQIFAIYGLEALVLAVLGIMIGLGLGLLVPFAGSDAVGAALPVRVLAGFYPAPLVKAGLAGLLVALAFGIAPLASVADTSPAAALRAFVTRLPWRRRLFRLLLALPFALALAVLVVQTSSNQRFALWFVIAATASLILFRLLAWLLARLALVLSRHVRGAGWRLALGQLFRPASPAPSVIVSLGIGLAVLTTLAQVESNLRNQIEERLPEEAPAFFFIDIQPNQKEAFLKAATEQQARDIHLSPMIRGRVTTLNGVPAQDVHIDPSAKWALDGDRGFSMAGEMPPGTQLVDGIWWPEDYQGTPLVSVDSRLAHGLGLEVGSTVGVDILGRDIEAQVASLRDIDWSAASMNFAFLFSPGVLEGAPYTLLATAKADPAQQDGVERAVTDALPNVSAIRVKDALDTIKGVLEGAGVALAVMAAATLPAGGLVLAGSVAASLRRRVYESVVLKVLGADSRMLFRAYLLEFLLLGLATALLAGLIGTLCAYGILDRLMHLGWRFLPLSSLGLLGFGLAATLTAGHLVTATALKAKAAPYLRNE